MIDLLRNIKFFILNIYHHRKGLWRSRPWDYSGTYLLIRDNLKYLSDSIEIHGNLLHKDRHVKHMRVCINLIDRLVKDNYHKENYGLIPIDTDGELQWFTIDCKPKHDLPRGKNLTKLSISLQKQDRELLFKLLNKHIETWWD